MKRLILAVAAILAVVSLGYVGLRLPDKLVAAQSNTINENPNQIVKLIRILTGTGSNVDLAGTLTMTAGTAAYTFTGTYASAPVCVATDTTAIAAVRVTVTTTTLTLNGSTGDIANFICMGRN